MLTPCLSRINICISCNFWTCHPRCPDKWFLQLHSLWQPELCDRQAGWVESGEWWYVLSTCPVTWGHWASRAGEEWSKDPREAPGLGPWDAKGWKVRTGQFACWRIQALIIGGVKVQSFRENGSTQPFIRIPALQKISLKKQQQKNLFEDMFAMYLQLPRTSALTEK